MSSYSLKEKEYRHHSVLKIDDMINTFKKARIIGGGKNVRVFGESGIPKVKVTQTRFFRCFRCFLHINLSPSEARL